MSARGIALRVPVRGTESPANADFDRYLWGFFRSCTRGLGTVASPEVVSMKWRNKNLSQSLQIQTEICDSVAIQWHVVGYRCLNRNQAARIVVVVIDDCARGQFGTGIAIE